MDWRERGACRTVDPDLFFPLGTTRPAQAQEARALAVCARCPVVDPCLAWAMAREDEGVWGGTTALQRRLTRHRKPDRVA
jgi:WhiB family redox-sensing transcriptional regulator